MNINKAIETLSNINDEINSLKSIELKELSKSDTVLITIDMVNGFAKEGTLYSDRIENIIPEVVKYNELFNEYNKVFIKDEHSDQSLEFNAFPKHCVGEESKLITELDRFNNESAVVIPKNSTNAFLCTGFQEWFKANEDVNNFAIIGDCSDICISQFAITLRTYFNEFNIKNKRVIVAIDAIETYHLDITNHNAELMNLISLYEMKMNGVEIYRNII